MNSDDMREVKLDLSAALDHKVRNLKVQKLLTGLDTYLDDRLAKGYGSDQVYPTEERVWGTILGILEAADKRAGGIR